MFAAGDFVALNDGTTDTRVWRVKDVWSQTYELYMPDGETRHVSHNQVISVSDATTACGRMILESMYGAGQDSV